MAHKGEKSYQVRKHEIDQKIINMDWETNPDWQQDMVEIDNMIKDFWVITLKREFNKKYGL